MAQEEELIKYCRFLEQQVQRYEKEIEQKNAELVQLKGMVRSLVAKQRQADKAKAQPKEEQGPSFRPASLRTVLGSQSTPAAAPASKTPAAKAPAAKPPAPVTARPQQAKPQAPAPAKQAAPPPPEEQKPAPVAPASPFPEHAEPASPAPPAAEAAAAPAAPSAASETPPAEDATRAETVSDAADAGASGETAPEETQARPLADRIELPKGKPMAPGAVTITYGLEPGRFLAAVLEGEREQEVESVKEGLAELKTQPSEEHHKVLQRLTTTHRVLTNQMARRIGKEDLSWEKRLFMRYGMLDESLMRDRMDIWQTLYEDRSEPGDTGIYYVDEWLEAVHDGEIHFSSIDEIALGGEKPDLKATGAKALSYEIQNIGQMQRMCVGPRGNKISILAQQFCFPGMDNPLIRREWLAEASEYIKKCDVTLFKRHYKGEDIEVEPLFMVSPGYGERGVCWEPYSPGKKGSTGPRICLCFAPPRAGLRAVVMGMADYRWEYSKADARQYWMTEGLTGDWLGLFKVKEQSKDLKSVFVDAYLQWVIKESQRIPTLETRFRQFLWRKTPFSEEIKERNIKGSGVFMHLFELDERLKERDESDKKLAERGRSKQGLVLGLDESAEPVQAGNEPEQETKPGPQTGAEPAPDPGGETQPEPPAGNQ